MLRVLVLLNTISHTSIPFELSVRIAEITDAEIVVVSFYDDDLTDVEISENVENLPIQIRCLGGTSRLDRKAWTAFWHELARGYDLVHTHHNFSGSVARVLAKQQGISVVDTEHHNHSSFSMLQNVINAPTLPLAERVISNSHATERSFRWYERLLINDEKCEVIYNGINVERIQSVVEQTNPAEKNGPSRICTVGRMVPIKNQSTLLHAFKSIVDQHPLAELLLIGDGPLRNDLESLARGLELTDNVRFTGEVPRRRVYELYAESDLFVIPSHAEGFCVAAVEAMASGLPVVASDIPVFHEVISDCGIYADPDHPITFATEIEKLLKGPRYRHEKAEACRTRARNRFTLDRTAKEYFKLYKSIVK